MSESHTIRSADTHDHEQWLTLWQHYLVFYKATVPDSTTALLWQRIQNPEHPFRCLLAVNKNTHHIDGLVHFFPHPNTWESEPVCYLEDLYVKETLRGGGIGEALINAVAAEATRQKWASVYWLTESNNMRARGLYDKMTGGTDGFVTYTLELEK